MIDINKILNSNFRPIFGDTQVDITKPLSKDIKHLMFDKGFYDGSGLYIFSEDIQKFYDEIKDNCEDFYASGYAYGILFDENHSKDFSVWRCCYL